MQNLETRLADIADAYVNESNYVDMLAAAFYRSTDIPPENCAVVHQEVDGKDAYYFARIACIDDDGELHLETVQHLGLLRRQLRRWLEALW